jgi:hypothetical protein
LNLRERSPVSGDLFVFAAALRIAAGFLPQFDPEVALIQVDGVDRLGASSTLKPAELRTHEPRVLARPGARAP